jgi:hypothetical protein
MPNARKPAITGIARPEGIKDDIGKYIFKKAAKATSRKREKAYVKMQKMGPVGDDKKFMKQSDKFEKLGKREVSYRAKSRGR